MQRRLLRGRKQRLSHRSTGIAFVVQREDLVEGYPQTWRAVCLAVQRKFNSSLHSSGRVLDACQHQTKLRQRLPLS
jgi:hypothetical protein